MAAARKISLALRDFRLPPRSSWELRYYELLRVIMGLLWVITGYYGSLRSE